MSNINDKTPNMSQMAPGMGAGGPGMPPGMNGMPPGMMGKEPSMMDKWKMFWKEYPERDIEYIREYPSKVSAITGDEIFEKKEITVYIHIPFCKSLCKYCPFTKYAFDENLLEDYLDALYKEIDMTSKLPYVQGAKVSALCFGGGTPTTLTGEQLVKLIETCKEKFNMMDGYEISIEANPDTVDEEKVKMMIGAGVNRISFGIQSFQDKYLEMIGRAHKAQSSIDAIKMVKNLGFNNIGIDLLYRIPGQTLEDWEKELKTAVDLGVDYIATFCLSLVPTTELFNQIMRGQLPPQPDEEMEYKMVDKIKEVLFKEGYQQHYLHDYALPGKECAYHAASFKAPQIECLALGAGGKSYINGVFYGNINPIHEYIDAVNAGDLPVAFGRKLTQRDKMSRYMVLGMKFLKIDKKNFQELFGVRVETVFSETLDKLESWGLIENGPYEIKVTRKGEKYISNVCKAFYSMTDWGVLQPNGIELQSKQGDFYEQFAK